MCQNFKTHSVACAFYYLLYARVAEFDHFAAFRTYEVIVLNVFMGFFKVSGVFSKLMPGDELAVNKQINGVVYGRFADAEFTAFHFFVEQFNVKMIIERIYLFQDSEALRRFPVAFSLQVFSKYRSCPFSCCIVHETLVLCRFILISVSCRLSAPQ